MQHADHFTRVLNERENDKKEKFSENRTENNADVADEIIENSDKNSAEDLVKSSNDETKIQKTAKSQIDIN